MLNTRQRAEEFGVGGTAVYLLKTMKWKHCGTPLKYPTSSGRAWVWWHCRVSSDNYKMAASRCAINIPTEERKSSRRARVQEEHKHDPLEIILDLPFGFPINNIISSLRCCMFIYSKVTSTRPTAVCLLAKHLIFFFVYLYVCVLLYMISKSTCIDPHGTRNGLSTWALPCTAQIHIPYLYI